MNFKDLKVSILRKVQQYTTLLGFRFHEIDVGFVGSEPVMFTFINRVEKRQISFVNISYRDSLTPTSIKTFHVSGVKRLIDFMIIGDTLRFFTTEHRLNLIALEAKSLRTAGWLIIADSATMYWLGWCFLSISRYHRRWLLVLNTEA